ncbi:MAG: hypothetical protein CRU78_11070 [Candidatus Accumulibacter phosphatis]|uniref:Uncharacterized protein n=1 Tax=Candidatus Accumulibacter phosphatis TaxID=327160 RepID=A0A6A7RTW8_9PROT|nr:hypothetical protein [Candidatus Accumulibacter phosphatis]
MANWAGDEFGGVELGHGRLRLRLIKLGDGVGELRIGSMETFAASHLEIDAAAELLGIDEIIGILINEADR